MLLPPKFIHVAKIEKSEFGKIQCIHHPLYRNGKNKAIKAHSGPVLKISLSRDEDFMISCSSDKTVKMWSPDGKFIKSFLGHTNWVR